MPEVDAPLTPMVKQYLEIKEKHRDAILFYRIGDFYEMFFDDAVVASKALDITLTSRNKNEPNPIPLCGVPYHSVQPYINKLITQGFRVALCDQVEDPKTAQGVVKREVTRVITPGLVVDSLSQDPNYLAVVVAGAQDWGLAFLEITTGDFRVAQLKEEELREELARLAPREVVIPESLRGWQFENAVIQTLPDWVFALQNARRWLLEQFQVGTLSGFDLEELPQGIIAAGAALYYVRETQKTGCLPHVTVLKKHIRGQFMVLGGETRKHLDLDSLAQVLDRTKTAMGRRLLREWLFFPLLKKEAIEERQAAVQEWLQHPIQRTALQGQLEGVYDLERLSGRLSLKTANARDLVALAGSLESLPALGKVLQGMSSGLLSRLAEEWNPLAVVRQRINEVLQSDPPFSIREGGMIRTGFCSEVDELRGLRGNSKAAIAAIEERERARTGINSLKVKFNQVFGYFIEVTTSHLAKVPADYVRKQTLTNAERFITPELKELEDKVLGAEGRLKSLEYEIFVALREESVASIPEILSQAGRLAVLDVLISLARVAEEGRYTCPKVEETTDLVIVGGRHPLVEKSLPAGSFVPNDIHLNTDDRRLLLITGPNMAGKSTIMRQVGLIALLAQVGSYVPAEEARIGLVDRIFTRVGADDRLSRGESTFMVEMSETARILHYATPKSLVILDEIGRGTSTFDGISIAWAVAEYLHDQIGARSLFATHYHELVRLSEARHGVKNVNVAVEEERGHITFLYRLIEGGASHSYGIHVAKLAGLPPLVISRAEQVLRELEKKKRVVEEGKKQDQGKLF